MMGASIIRLLCRKESVGILRNAGGGRWDGRMMFSSNSNSNSTKSNPCKIPSSSPWLMLPPSFEKRRGGMVYNFYSLADDEVLQFNKYGEGADPIESPDDDALVVGSSHGWLALMNRRNNDLYLSNPLSRRHIKLPPIDGLPHPETNLRRGGRGRVSKVILGAGRAMMSFGPGDRLAFCRPGRSREWTPIGELFLEREDSDTKYGRVYDDFVHSSTTNLFNCLLVSENDDVSFEDWDLMRWPPRIHWAQKEAFPAVQTEMMEYLPEVEPFGYKWLDDDDGKLRRCWIVRHLVYVEQSEMLFVLFRYMKNGGKTEAFTVARVEKEKEGGKVRLVGCDLEGFAVFIGTNHSFALPLPAQDFPHLKNNSIYFTDSKTFRSLEYDYSGTRQFPGGDIGIFDCANGTLTSCYFPLKEEGLGPTTSLNAIVPAPIWFTPSPSPSLP